MPEAESATPEDRRDERTHLFVIGTLYFGRSSAPVRVRNLSATGALIEGTSLPHVGTEIILRRGDLKASGIAVWVASGRAGLSFKSPVAVSSWLPTKEPSRQRHIDRFVFGLKHAGLAANVAHALPIEGAGLSMPAVVAGLERLQAELGQLADKLAQDVVLVATHPEVQFLDEAAQRIGKIVQAIQAAER